MTVGSEELVCQSYWEMWLKWDFFHYRKHVMDSLLSTA